MKNILEMTGAQARGVKYILSDVDDTIARDGTLLDASRAALLRLRSAGLKVVLVTGRSAGQGEDIARQWPADGVIAENGACAYWLEGTVLREEAHPLAVRNDHPVLKQVRERALAEVPGLRDAADQGLRRYDIALSYAEEEPVLPLGEAEKARDIAVGLGAKATISSIHINIWMGDYDKVSMSERFLSNHFGWSTERDPLRAEAVYVGDSLNDEAMFARFPLACAVANVRKYTDRIAHLPAFAAAKEYGDGFAEITCAILEKRKQ